MDETGIHVPPDAPVEALGSSDRAMVELLRALARGGRLIVLDEPTARLTQQESERLYAVMRKIRARGVALVYISHFLDEVLALSDRVTRPEGWMRRPNRRRRGRDAAKPHPVDARARR